MSDYQSWGRYPKAEHRIRHMYWRSDRLPLQGIDGPVLPYGNGRSYGDLCLNHKGFLLAARDLDRFISFNAKTGVLTLEAGVTLDEILRRCVSQGWFLPVTPGTRFITVGGAIANDVHGKNHHRAGTFGRYVRRFELLRSDGQKLLCSSTENAELFAATVGGLGLTGLITWAEIQLAPVAHPDLMVETIKFCSLDEFFQLSRESDRDYEYSVAWLDCLAKGPNLGRGLFMRANHLPEEVGDFKMKEPRSLSVPLDIPGWVLNSFSVRAFNFMYFHGQTQKSRRKRTGFANFFYPLDFIADWNRLYGRQGLTQYQCVVPLNNAEALREMLQKISHSGLGSFLAVLKVFGSQASPGLMSFPQPGVTFALDFPLKSPRTLALMAELILMTRRAGGRVYPAKDCCMSPEDFTAFYPQWTELQKHIDPRFSSSFWRRVTDGEKG